MVMTEKMKSTASERMAGHVRPLEERDVAQVADLHQRVLGKTNNAPSLSLRAHLSRIFLRHPWYAESLRSFVYQENGGKVAGCIGVMPRPMSFNGRGITAAISHSFIVEPGSRSTLVALELAKSFLS